MDTGRSAAAAAAGQGNAAAAAAEHGAICQVHVQDGTYKTVLITSETPDVRDIIRTVSFPFLPPLHCTPHIRRNHQSTVLTFHTSPAKQT